MAVSALSLLARLRHASGRERQQVKWLAYVAVLLTASLVRPAQVEPGRAGASRVPRSRPVGHLHRDRDRGLASSPVRHRPADQPHPGLRVAHRPARRWSIPAECSCWVSCSTLSPGSGGWPWPPPPWPRRRCSSRPAAASKLSVDRRFNRRRYNAAQTIEAFSTRLRDQIDLETLTTELLAIVDQTTEPTRVSLWLPPSAPGSSGATPQSEARPTTWAY